ncbi:DegV family protein ['Camptotheca acuminata' phytoplasma]|uniref:DegV family protein n=1 Tax='Camptotheca acuminata' phytoplasma TaxID=3239192 RepID=UPI00351A85A8
MNSIDLKKDVKIVATSTSCLDYYNDTDTSIDLIRIKIHINDKTYIDGETITAPEFYDMFKKNNNLVIKTSQPSLGELVLYFENLSKQGYKKVFVATISDKLSGTYNIVVQAQKQVSKIIEVIPYNTNTVCFSEGYFSLQAQRYFSQNLSVQEVVQKLDFLKKNNTIFFIVNSLTQLINNGRLSKKKGFIGRFLRIKPILQVNDQGKIVLIDKKITIEKAFRSMISKIKDYVKDQKFLIHLYTTGNPDLKSRFKILLQKEFNLDDILEIPSTPAIGAHVGNNVLGVGVIILK